MEKVHRYEFSCHTQPKVEMKIMTPIDRVQPHFMGFDEKGREIWEGRAMERWQMEALRVEYSGDFKGFWDRLRIIENTTDTEWIWEIEHEDKPGMQLVSHPKDKRFSKNQNPTKAGD